MHFRLSLCLALPACLVAGGVLLGASALQAQNFASPGSNWSSSWGFQSMSQRSLLVQQAQAIRAASVPAGPGTVVHNTSTTINDNRTRYQEIIGGSGGMGDLTLQVADVIGQNTNSVGSMNTGSTTIEIRGDGNSVTAVNSSESNGCIDGSVQLLSSTLTDMSSASGALQPTVTYSGRSMSCAQ